MDVKCSPQARAGNTWPTAGSAVLRSCRNLQGLDKLEEVGHQGLGLGSITSLTAFCPSLSLCLCLLVGRRERLSPVHISEIYLLETGSAHMSGFRVLHTILSWKACCLAARSADGGMRSPGFLCPTEGMFKHHCGSDTLYVMAVSRSLQSDLLLLLPSSQIWTPRVLFIDRYSNC